MTDKLVPANPAAVMVIRDITPNITTLSVPFMRFGVFEIGGRCTIGEDHPRQAGERRRRRPQRASAAHTQQCA